MSPRDAIRDHLPHPALLALTGMKREARALLLASRGVECPICGSHRFHVVSDPVNRNREHLCQRCLSLERHRRIALLLRRCTNIYVDRLNVLHIAPERSLRRELEGLENIQYTTGDLHAKDVDVLLDVTAINVPDETFDVILCSHVLEHVLDDRMAMREMRRVLKGDGWALINVPSDPSRSEIFEDSSIVDPHERLRHFGQEDHVRVYSSEGFQERLREAGFTVTVDPLTFTPHERARYLLDGDAGWDHSYLCRRSPRRDMHCLEEGD
jgi:SAM-dependent methyltransferase